jgi:hypothetical protein
MPGTAAPHAHDGPLRFDPAWRSETVVRLRPAPVAIPCNADGVTQIVMSAHLRTARKLNRRPHNFGGG